MPPMTAQRVPASRHASSTRERSLAASIHARSSHSPKAAVLVDLDPTAGHEQKSVRPCVVVSDPAVASDQRYPLVGVVPLIATEGRGALYPRIAAGTGGLRKESWALTDQVRSIDKRQAEVARRVENGVGSRPVAGPPAAARLREERGAAAGAGVGARLRNRRPAAYLSLR